MKLLDRARVQVRFCSHFSLSPSFLVLECSSFPIALLVIFRRKKRPRMIVYTAVYISIHARQLILIKKHPMRRFKQTRLNLIASNAQAIMVERSGAISQGN